MQCVKCSNTIEDKKFKHPLLDEWLCLNCFERRMHHNRVELTSPVSQSLASRLAEGGLKDDLDLGFILCTEGGNHNRDGFDREGLSSDYKTAINQRLDWEHTNEVIGAIKNSEFIAAEDITKKRDLGITTPKSLIYVEGVLWKYWNEDRAEQVVARHAAGQLRFSMEDLFDYSICSVCGSSSVYDDEYCEHLSNRFSTKDNAYRILRGNKFAGAGVVTRPADQDAIGITLAKDKRRYLILSEILDPDTWDYFVYAKGKYHGIKI